MTATNHALAGAVIGLTVHQPWLALPLAFASHFVVDAIPHFTFPRKELFKRNFKTLLVIDMMACVIMALAVLAFGPANAFMVAVCMFLATSPDLSWIYFHGYKSYMKHQDPYRAWFARFHHWIQIKTVPERARLGITVELLWLVVMSSLVWSLAL